MAKKPGALVLRLTLKPMKMDKWVCKFCDKVFDSAKALGGHVRIHKQKRKIDEDDEEQVGMTESLKHVCSVCGRDFDKKKSLFGHMRSHPERNWRGIRPPKTSNNNHSSCLSFSRAPVSQGQWGITGQRSRGGVAVKASLASSEDSTLTSSDKQTLEAAQHLMFLANHYNESWRRSVNETEMENGKLMSFDLNELPAVEDEAAGLV